MLTCTRCGRAAPARSAAGAGSRCRRRPGPRGRHSRRRPAAWACGGGRGSSATPCRRRWRSGSAGWDTSWRHGTQVATRSAGGASIPTASSRAVASGNHEWRGSGDVRADTADATSQDTATADPTSSTRAPTLTAQERGLMIEPARETSPRRTPLTAVGAAPVQQVQWDQRRSAVCRGRQPFPPRRHRRAIRSASRRRHREPRLAVTDTAGERLRALSRGQQPILESPRRPRRNHFGSGGRGCAPGSSPTLRRCPDDVCIPTQPVGHVSPRPSGPALLVLETAGGCRAWSRVRSASLVETRAPTCASMTGRSRATHASISTPAGACRIWAAPRHLARRQEGRLRDHSRPRAHPSRPGPVGARRDRPAGAGDPTRRGRPTSGPPGFPRWMPWTRPLRCPAPGSPFSDVCRAARLQWAPPAARRGRVDARPRSRVRSRGGRPARVPGPCPGAPARRRAAPRSRRRQRQRDVRGRHTHRRE